ncbi:hypothetical protein NDU88_001724 [Pleurodeles waltl]|uniref:Uncharacterized protein n=1 Tax=Pleurodeles waltl TaxID=8319 RepID=A0AAV7U791_PLEWA|nr:hypothetical protein NDU88_001724 [Pleurodeles waltl]
MSCNPWLPRACPLAPLALDVLHIAAGGRKANGDTFSSVRLRALPLAAGKQTEAGLKGMSGRLERVDGQQAGASEGTPEVQRRERGDSGSNQDSQEMADIRHLESPRVRTRNLTLPAEKTGG